MTPWLANDAVADPPSASPAAVGGAASHRGSAV